MRATSLNRNRAYWFTSPTGDVLDGQSTIDWERGYGEGWRDAINGVDEPGRGRTGYLRGWNDYHAHSARNESARKETA